MTDKEIIRALECCYRSYEYCDKCAYFNSGTGSCKLKLLKDAFYLTNRQQAKIKRLQKYDEERDIALHSRLIETARAEAIREFAERLKEDLKSNNYIVSFDRIDNLVKEMAGEQE